jgi:serine/threonine-protein kinase
MPIATGGMAMVWAARLKGTRGFQKIVAVKTILPKLSDDPEFEQMFLDEASLASQIRHPHVVEILDLGEQDGVLYLVMEWIDGVPLNQVLRAARKRGGVPLPVAVRICMQAAAGLHAAHELRDDAGQLVGLVHRDVSPQNVLVTYDGVAKVVDFGVAKATAAGGSVTQAGHIKGKVAYMAPEQIRADTIDRRVDVFSLGCVLYYLTTGKHPFRKESDGATMYGICAPEPAVSPRRLVPSYPVSLERVVMEALAKDPAKRFPTANDLLRALDHSLPASMRASTDEEVAKFLRSLFSEQREEHKTALSEALARADELSRSGADGGPRAPERKLRELLDSQPPPSAASASGVSGIAALSSPGIPLEATQPSVPSALTGESTASNVSRALLAAPDFDEPPRRRSVWPKLVALLLVLGGAAAAAWVLRARIPFLNPPPAAAPATGVLETPATAAPSAAPEPTASREPAPPPTASESAEPAEPRGSASVDAPPLPSTEEKPAAAPARPVVARPARPAPARPTAPSKPSAPTWKQDPGF